MAIQTALFSQNPYQAALKRDLLYLKKRSIYFGTSSWKYEGWRGLLYLNDYRSRKAFEGHCLEEYAQIFPMVGGDFSYYQPPSGNFVDDLLAQTPDDFRIILKATDIFTMRHFPRVPERYRERSGQRNPDFLSAETYLTRFLKPFETVLRQRPDTISTTLFEFTAFDLSAQSYDLESFCRDLKAFKHNYDTQFRQHVALAPGRALPKIAVEVRNREFCTEEFHGVLLENGFVPCLTLWSRMPSLHYQWACYQKAFERYAGVASTIEHAPLVLRIMMRPGLERDYVEEHYAPFDKIKKTLEPERQLITEIGKQYAKADGAPLQIIINNHFEGCSHQSIAAIARALCVALDNQ